MTGIILITGASRGIGAATARLLAASGQRLCLTWRKEQERAAALADELSASGKTPMLQRLDVAS